MAVDEKDVARVADDRRKALNLAIAQIEKTCGKGAIMRMGQDSWAKVDFIPTGAINLDAAIGIGGIPRGRITEIYGPESSGKTTLALHIRSEEHTSELQSRRDLVCRLLLEKKNT